MRTTATSAIVGTCMVLLLAAAGGSSVAEGAEPLPYTVAIRVEYGEPSGPAVIADEVLRLTHHHIEAREWFEDVVAVRGEERPDTDLLLVVRLDEYQEETVYDTSMAARLEADDPKSQQQYRVIFNVIVRMELIDLVGNHVVRAKRFRSHFIRSPEFFGEDLEFAVREDAIRDIADGIRRVTSKGNLQKLGRKIESLRATPPSAAR